MASLSNDQMKILLMRGARNNQLPPSIIHNEGSNGSSYGNRYDRNLPNRYGNHDRDGNLEKQNKQNVHTDRQDYDTVRSRGSEKPRGSSDKPNLSRPFAGIGNNHSPSLTPKTQNGALIHKRRLEEMEDSAEPISHRDAEMGSKRVFGSGKTSHNQSSSSSHGTPQREQTVLKPKATTNERGVPIQRYTLEKTRVQSPLQKTPSAQKNGQVPQRSNQTEAVHKGTKVAPRTVPSQNGVSVSRDDSPDRTSIRKVTSEKNRNTKNQPLSNRPVDSRIVQSSNELGLSKSIFSGDTFRENGMFDTEAMEGDDSDATIPKQESDEVEIDVDFEEEEEIGENIEDTEGENDEMDKYTEMEDADMAELKDMGIVLKDIGCVPDLSEYIESWEEDPDVDWICESEIPKTVFWENPDAPVIIGNKLYLPENVRVLNEEYKGTKTKITSEGQKVIVPIIINTILVKTDSGETVRETYEDQINRMKQELIDSMDVAVKNQQINMRDRRQLTKEIDEMVRRRRNKNSALDGLASIGDALERLKEKRAEEKIERERANTLQKTPKEVVTMESSSSEGEDDDYTECEGKEEGGEEEGEEEEEDGNNENHKQSSPRSSDDEEENDEEEDAKFENDEDE
jgi:hypothetical protein